MIGYQAQDVGTSASGSAPQTVLQEGRSPDTTRSDAPHQNALRSDASHALELPLLRQYLQSMRDDPQLAKSSPTALDPRFPAEYLSRSLLPDSRSTGREPKGWRFAQRVVRLCRTENAKRIGRPFARAPLLDSASHAQRPTV